VLNSNNSSYCPILWKFGRLVHSEDATPNQGWRCWPGNVSITSFLPRGMECRRGLAMRIMVVHLSVKRVHCDKTEERSVQIFTALHEMQTRYSDENSVCLSVCLSVCHTRDPWQNWRKIGPDFYTIRKNIYPSFLRRRMVGGGRPLLRDILGQPTPVGAKSPIFNQ